jgi:hypothetical protein
MVYVEQDCQRSLPHPVPRSFLYKLNSQLIHYIFPLLGRFDVDDIKDVVWDDSPYDNLVLPSEERELVFAFANCPRFSKLGFDDFVVHKGTILV